MSADFDFIRDKMLNAPAPLPIKATYGTTITSPRILCAHVLGYKNKGKNGEVVLCWQLAIPATGTQPAQPAAWRCFNISGLTIDKTAAGQPPPNLWQTPPNYSQTQLSVKHPVYQLPD